jgi:hypothetical protein
MVENKTPNIGIIIADAFPDEFVTKLSEDIFHPDLNVVTKKIPFGHYGSLEWAIPTAIGIFIFKSYFDSFLKEAGKEHYHLLSDWLKKSSKNSRLIMTTTIVALQSTDKIDARNTQSKSFSIQLVNPDTQVSVKFLFDENLSQEGWDLAIDNLLNLVEEYYLLSPNDEITITIKKNNLRKEVYATIQSETGLWEFTDLYKLAIEKINKNKYKDE